MTDKPNEPKYEYNVTIRIVADGIDMVGHGFQMVEQLEIDLHKLWRMGFRGVLRIEGEMG